MSEVSNVVDSAVARSLNGLLPCPLSEVLWNRYNKYTKILTVCLHTGEKLTFKNGIPYNFRNITEVGMTTSEITERNDYWVMLGMMRLRPYRSLIERVKSNEREIEWKQTYSGKLVQRMINR